MRSFALALIATLAVALPATASTYDEAVLTLVRIDADIDAQIEAASEQAAMDGLRLVQFVIEDGIAEFGELEPEACYLDWWAAQLTGLHMLGTAVRLYVMGDQDTAAVVLEAATAVRVHAPAETC